MFQRKVNEIFKEVLNVFGICDDILPVDYKADGSNHDRTLQKVLQI